MVDLFRQHPNTNGEIVLNRSHSDHSGIWSDPGDVQPGDFVTSPSMIMKNNSKEGLRSRNVNNVGIQIPSFLQPLFGFDFVPYINNSNDDDDNNNNIIIGDDINDNNIEIDNEFNRVENANDSAVFEDLTESGNLFDDDLVQDDDLLLDGTGKSEISLDIALQHPTTTSTKASAKLDRNEGALHDYNGEQFNHKPTPEYKQPIHHHQHQQEHTSREPISPIEEETAVANNQLNNTSPSKRPRRRISKALAKFVKNRRRADSASGILSFQNRNNNNDSGANGSNNNNSNSGLRSRLASWHGEKLSSSLQRGSSFDDSSSSFGGIVLSSPTSSVAAAGTPTNATTTTTATPTKFDTTWVKNQQAQLETHQTQLLSVQAESQAVKTRASEIERHIGDIQFEIVQLQQALQKSQQRLQHEMQELGAAQSQLNQLENTAVNAAQAVLTTIQHIQQGMTVVSSNGKDDTEAVTKETNSVTEPSESDITLQDDTLTKEPPLRERANTAPILRSSSFMRVHDLEIQAKDEKGASLTSNNSNNNEEKSQNESSSFSSSSDSAHSKPLNDFIYVDHNITTILENLVLLAYDIATDESARFCPTRDTKNMIAKTNSLTESPIPNWPVKPWHLVTKDDIYIWTGGVPHNGFGSDWPVCKARGNINTTPRELLDYLRDSSRVKEYNKMSQGREEILTIQDGVDTTVDESAFGFVGDAKIVKSVNKHYLFPKAIEVVSLTHSRPLENAPGSYMIVNRSVFEDDTGEHKCTKNTIRSEMLLGVVLLRPTTNEKGKVVTELTSVTHVYSPGVPEMIAKRAAPGAAYNMMKDIQSIFKK